VQVSVDNTFDVGSIRLVKRLTGGSASDVATGTEFTLQLACQVLIDGGIADVDLENQGVVTLTAPDDLEASYTGLPTGAHCTVTEPDTGGADATTIAPGEVIVGDGTMADVVAVNTFNPTPPPPAPPGGGGKPAEYRWTGPRHAGGRRAAARRRRWRDDHRPAARTHVTR
jgi:hypothetical protein